MSEKARIEIRVLSGSDAAAFQRIRLEGLLESPTAFGSSHEEEVEFSLAKVEERLAPADGRAVFGAFDGETLVGVTGIRREHQLKLRHKTYIWGVYVTSPYRGKQVGRRLLEAAIECARSMEGVRQATLTVTVLNEFALSLYLSLGFVEFGLEPNALSIEGEYYDEKYLALMLY